MSVCNLLPEAADGDMLSSVDASLLNQLLERCDNTTVPVTPGGSPRTQENDPETSTIMQSTLKPQEVLLSEIDLLQASLDVSKKADKSGVSTVSCNIYTRGSTKWYSHTWDQRIGLGENIVDMEVVHPVSHFRQMRMKFPLPANHRLYQVMLETAKEMLGKRKHTTKSGVNRGQGDTAPQYGKRFKRSSRDQ